MDTKNKDNLRAKAIELRRYFLTKGKELSITLCEFLVAEGFSPPTKPTMYPRVKYAQVQ